MDHVGGHAVDLLVDVLVLGDVLGLGELWIVPALDHGGGRRGVGWSVLLVSHVQDFSCHAVNLLVNVLVFGNITRFNLSILGIWPVGDLSRLWWSVLNSVDLLDWWHDIVDEAVNSFVDVLVFGNILRVLLILVLSILWEWPVSNLGRLWCLCSSNFSSVSDRSSSWVT